MKISTGETKIINRVEGQLNDVKIFTSTSSAKQNNTGQEENQYKNQNQNTIKIAEKKQKDKFRNEAIRESIKQKSLITNQESNKVR